MKTFVVGDIHGNFKALKDCLQACGFSYEEDRLIALGDVCDRGRKVKECVEELLKIRNCIYLLGNHDAWALDWAINGRIDPDWLEQGGAETTVSYKGIGLPEEHIRFFAKAPLWFIDKNRLFLHAGFDSERSVEVTPKEMFFWDRVLLKRAQELSRFCPEWRFGDYDEIFIGHTPTMSFGKKEPQKFCNVWALDTGAGCGGKLTIMDVETKEYWQSEGDRALNLDTSTQMKKLLYIDIDGVLLGKNDPSSIEVVLAPHAKEFLRFCLSRYQCFWLTTHCRDGNSEGLLKMLRQYADDSVMTLIRNIPPARWKTFKTEAIDFNSDFYWVEDQLLAHEIEQLNAHVAFDRWIQIDTRKDPEGLKKALQILKS